MGIASKIPVAGEGDRQGAEGEAYRSDHQTRDGATRRSASGNILRKYSFRIFRRNRLCVSPPVSALRSRCLLRSAGNTLSRAGERDNRD